MAGHMMLESNPSSSESELEFAVDNMDVEDGFHSNTSDYLSTEDEEDACSDSQEGSSTHQDDASLEEQQMNIQENVQVDSSQQIKRNHAFLRSQASSSRQSQNGSSQHFQDNPTSSKSRGGPGSVQIDPPPQLMDTSISSDSENHAPPKKKAKITKPKKAARASVQPSPRGHLPRRAINILKDWVLGHLWNPYPAEEEKLELVNQTGLTYIQICNWFINFRRRDYPKLCEEYGVDPTAYRRNRKALKGANSSGIQQSSPQSNSGCSQQSSPQPNSGICKQSSPQSESGSTQQCSTGDSLNKDSSISLDVNYQRGFPDNAQDISKLASIGKENADPVLASIPRSESFVHVGTASLAFLFDVLYLDEQLEKQPREEGVSRVEWIEKRIFAEHFQHHRD